MKQFLSEWFQLHLKVTSWWTRWWPGPTLRLTAGPSTQTWAASPVQRKTSTSPVCSCWHLEWWWLKMEPIPQPICFLQQKPGSVCTGFSGGGRTTTAAPTGGGEGNSPMRMWTVWSWTHHQATGTVNNVMRTSPSSVTKVSLRSPQSLIRLIRSVLIWFFVLCSRQGFSTEDGEGSAERRLCRPERPGSPGLHPAAGERTGVRWSKVDEDPEQWDLPLIKHVVQFTLTLLLSSSRTARHFRIEQVLWSNCTRYISSPSCFFFFPPVFGSDRNRAAQVTGYTSWWGHKS